MDPNTFPTKGNLMRAKNSLVLASMGYGLMDKKRNILIRELMGLIDEAKDIQSEIDSTFRAAYAALQKANIELGINYVQEVGASVPVETACVSRPGASWARRSPGTAREKPLS